MQGSLSLSWQQEGKGARNKKAPTLVLAGEQIKYSRCASMPLFYAVMEGEQPNAYGAQLLRYLAKAKSLGVDGMCADAPAPNSSRGCARAL